MSKIDIEGIVALGLIGVLAAIVLAAVLVAASAVCIMIAWNVVVPIFHGPTINFWQAVGVNFILLIIKSVLFDRK
jgi:hypothetical protein